MPVVGWIDSPEFDRHENPVGHPESAARLGAIRLAIAASGLSSKLVSALPNEVDRALLERIHDPRYIDRVEQLSARGTILDPEGDTYVGPGTFRAALLAAGAVSLAVSRVMSGAWNRAFCSVRPPGHHARRAAGMGFCVFNNVAVGAMAALDLHGAERVAILDWDAHHGNGTEEILGSRSDVLYASWHQAPFFPHTADKNLAGHANTVHCRLQAGMGDAQLLAGWYERVEPALSEFEPDLLLISAGFDADRRDPLADLQASPQGFRELTRLVSEFSASCQERIVSVLEGGYDLDALAEDTVVHVEALLAD